MALSAMCGCRAPLSRWSLFEKYTCVRSWREHEWNQIPNEGMLPERQKRQKKNAFFPNSSHRAEDMEPASNPWIMFSFCLFTYFYFYFHFIEASFSHENCFSHLILHTQRCEQQCHRHQGNVDSINRAHVTHTLVQQPMRLFKKTKNVF